MATTPLNKSSQYVQSLVDFILDTKPYHSKLTEVVEEYQFFDNLNVTITENSFVRTMHKAAWPFGYFSGGNPLNRTMGLQRLIVPDLLRVQKNNDQLNNIGGWKAFRDENLDMLGVPFVFSKKQFDGVGIAEAWLELDGTVVQPYVEGLDYLQSHGAQQFQIRQLLDFTSAFKPLWSETRTDGVIADVTAASIALANDLGNPLSANRQLRTFVASIASHLSVNVIAAPPAAAAAYADAVAACASLIVTLDGGSIPPAYVVGPGGLVTTGDYDRIVQGAQNSGVIPLSGYTDWIGENGQPLVTDTYVDEHFANLIPPLVVNTFSDMELYRSGTLDYDNASVPGLDITNVVANINAPQYEEWVLECIDTSPQRWSVTGSQSGLVGSFTSGSPFSIAAISFDTASTGSPSLGERLVLTPRESIVIHPDAVTEAWNLIKINPRTYDRPVFNSTRYGYIRDLSAVEGSVTLLDNTLPTGSVILTATSATNFVLSSTAEPLYTGNVTVGTTFNDGRLGFTIIAGSAHPFVPGDRFYIQISNGPAEAINFDLYYGYDLDSYDNWDSLGGSVVYDGTNGSTAGDPIRFAYDSRFIDYDVGTMNLVVTQAAVDGRQFRLVAVADGDPIATLKKDGSGPVEYVDLEDALGGVTPPVYSMPGDPNPAVDLSLFYANSFRLEYSDDGFNTTTVAGTVPVGGSFADPLLGISLDLPAGSKPFVAAKSDDGLLQPLVEGGDMFQFTVMNPPPSLAVEPVKVVSNFVPHLVMHGDGYYWTPPASWTVTFTSATAYTIAGLYSTGLNAGLPVVGFPQSAVLPLPGTGAREGATFRTDEVHFTIKTGMGFQTGDQFTFNTFENKPSIAVHGTVSGWQPDAEFGKWYFNGKIGFKADLPLVEVFDKVVDVNPQGFTTYQVANTAGFYNWSPVNWVQVERLRPDTPSLNYTFTWTPNGYVVTRSDIAVVGWCPQTGTFNDQYIRVNTSFSNTGINFIVKVTASVFDFWQAQDTLVVRTDIDGLYPTVDDFVGVRKTEEGGIGIRLNYDTVSTPLPDPNWSVTLHALAQDPAFIDTFTNGVPLEVTSPETAWLSGWLPTYLQKFDSATSVAEFPDSASRFTVRSAATGQIIGRVLPQATPLEEPTYFEWDTAFFNTYLPLNAQANIVTYGTGLDENLRVLMSEKVDFMFSGDALLVNALFQEVLNISVSEDHDWTINLDYQQPMAVNVGDDFGGFLAGYDNLPYDAEDATGLDIPSLTAAQGQYDTGQPLVDHYLRAAYLSTLLVLSPAEQDELTMLTMLIQPYLVGGLVIGTTLQDFITAFNADAYATGGTSPTMGIPAEGMAIDHNQAPGDVGQTSIGEAMFIYIAEDSDLMDENPFDSEPMDAYGDDSAYMLSNTLPPVPNPTPVFTTYVALETPLEVPFNFPVRIFDISFANPPPAMPIPNILIWIPSELTPLPAGVVQVVSNGLFRFTIPTASEAKIVVT